MLNENGNLEAARLFRNYVDQVKPPDLSLPGKRVILQGFGLFKGLALNSSGAIVSNIADPQIWPSEIKANERIRLAENVLLHDGQFETTTGGVAFQRSLTINGQLYNFRILVLDVLWETAGAIVAHEMNQFQPEAVLMLGGGGGPILEGGALNFRKYMHGYYANGELANDNMPLHPQGLNGLSEDAELLMNWDNARLYNAVKPLLKEAELPLSIVPSARPSNVYLCNHVSFMALTAAQNKAFSLAGGKISLQPKIMSNPKIGFFHLPWELPLERDTIERWGSLILSIAYFQSQ